MKREQEKEEEGEGEGRAEPAKGGEEEDKR